MTTMAIRIRKTKAIMILSVYSRFTNLVISCVQTAVMGLHTRALQWSGNGAHALLDVSSSSSIACILVPIAAICAPRRQPDPTRLTTQQGTKPQSRRFARCPPPPPPHTHTHTHTHTYTHTYTPHTHTHTHHNTNMHIQRADIQTDTDR
jgi:hypothetical protein